MHILLTIFPKFFWNKSRGLLGLTVKNSTNLIHEFPSSNRPSGNSLVLRWCYIRGPGHSQDTARTSLGACFLCTNFSLHMFSKAIECKQTPVEKATNAKGLESETQNVKDIAQRNGTWFSFRFRFAFCPATRTRLQESLLQDRPAAPSSSVCLL